MTFLLFIPLAVFSLVVLLALSIHIRIEITQRRRVALKSMRRVFRPIVIQGGKGKIAAINPLQPPTGDEEAASPSFKLVV